MMLLISQVVTLKLFCSAYMVKVEEFQKDPQFINGLNAEISFEIGSAPHDWFSSSHNHFGSIVELKSSRLVPS